MFSLVSSYLTFIIICLSNLDNLGISRPPPVNGAFEYVLTVERYDPVSQIIVQYRQVAGLQVNDFPYTLQNVPPGYYRSLVNAVIPSGLRPASSGLNRVGDPGEHILLICIFFPIKFYHKMQTCETLLDLFTSFSCSAYTQPVIPETLPSVSVSDHNIVTVGVPNLSGGNVGSFTSWEIQWRSVGSDDWKTATIPTSSTSYTLPGEQTGGVYEVRVRAVSPSDNSLFTWPYPLTLPALCKSFGVYVRI